MYTDLDRNIFTNVHCRRCDVLIAVNNNISSDRLPLSDQCFKHLAVYVKFCLVKCYITLNSHVEIYYRHFSSLESSHSDCIFIIADNYNLSCGKQCNNNCSYTILIYLSNTYNLTLNNLDLIFSNNNDLKVLKVVSLQTL